MNNQNATSPASQPAVEEGIEPAKVAPPTPPQVPMALLQPSNPDRLVDWCWRLAKRLFLDTKNETQMGDDSVKRVLSYLRITRGNPSSYISPWPALTDALAIKKAATQHNLNLRVELEAYTLAGESNIDLSHRFGLKLEVVDVYQSVLFDVRDRLDNRRVIVNSFLTPADLPLKEDNWKVFTRLVGLYGRSDILDEYREYRRHPRPSPLRTFRGLTDFDLELQRTRLHVRYWILRALLEVSANTSRPQSPEARKSTIATIDSLKLGIRLIGTELLLSQEASAFREKQIQYAAGTCC